MYTKILTLCIVLFLITTVSYAKIWRVNNNGGGGGDFTTAQAANDAGSVLAGDTIHLEPSPNSYGNLITNKRLVWISTGAFLSAHPGEQYSATAGRIGALSVNSGSENSVLSIYIESQVSIQAANIRMERCYIGGPIMVQTGSPNNDVIINCYCNSYLLLYTGTNHFVSNNIFANFLSIQAPASAIVQNNVFNAVTTTPDVVNNSTLQNNIFNKAVGAYTFTNCTVQYNMSGSGGVLPAGNFNQNNVPMANVFVNNSGTTDGDFVLKAGSPAIGSGAAGADMGAYGGTTPFKIALQPAIPSIYKIIAPFVPAGSTMNVTFSTKSNN